MMQKGNMQQVSEPILRTRVRAPIHSARANSLPPKRPGKRVSIDGVLPAQRPSSATRIVSPTPLLKQAPPIKRPLGPVTSGIKRAPAAPLSQQDLAKAPSLTPQAEQATPKKAKKARRWHQYLQMVAVLILAVILGFLSQSAMLGQLTLIAYAIIAIILKVKSNTTFSMALIALITTMSLLILRHNQEAANTFAIYTFWLLAIGTVCLIFEVNRGKTSNINK